MKDHKDFEYEIELVMTVLDELVRDFGLLRKDRLRNTSTLRFSGWASESGKVGNISFSFSAVQPTRQEVQDRVRSIVMRPKLRGL